MGHKGNFWTRRFWSWVDTPEMRNAWFVEKQLRAYHSGTYTSSCGSVFFILLMAAVSSANGINLLAAIGLSAFAVSAIARHVRSLAYAAPNAVRDIGAEMRWIHRHSAISGVAVAMALLGALIVPLAAMPGIAALIVIAIMLGGSWSIDMFPRAALALLLAVAAGSITAFLFINTTEAVAAAAIIASFTIFFAAHCMVSFNSFAVRLLRARELADSAETVQLLLNDFEEHGADWLWETGLQGRIVAPSARFVEVSAYSAPMLGQLRLTDLFDPGHERAGLERLLQKGEPFRDVIVRLTRDGDEYWWSLSGRPMLNDAGALTGMRGVATDVSAAKRAEAKIAYMAHYDGLTDLPNRRLFNEALNHALATRGDAGVAILYLDVDRLKEINDTLGHTIGDEMLKIAAERIESCLGGQDVVARLGGDEFAVLIAKTDGSDRAETAARAILTAMAEPLFVDRQEIQSGVSIGIAIAPGHGETAATLIKNADLALYRAKQSGRARFAQFEPSMHDAMQARRLIETDLRAALGRDQFALHYQPLVNLTTGETASFEALLRWNHPEHGLITPAAFLPIAEDTGQIVQLGEWGIRTALIEVARWPATQGVSVSLSAMQVRSATLVPMITNALAASGVAAHRLELAIAEAGLTHDTQATLAVLNQLRALGVRLALDDFGTGGSSLNAVRSFAFDKIKIDRCIIDDVDSRKDARFIVNAITGLAANLGMATAAKGVQRDSQIDELRRAGCTEVQGDVLGKPLPVDQIAWRAGPASLTASDVVPFTSAKPPVRGKPSRRKAA